MFENKGKWVKQISESAQKNEDKVFVRNMTTGNSYYINKDSFDAHKHELIDDSEDIFNDEEQVDEACKYRNEVRYIDPANLDKYSKDEIEEVTTASGEKRYKRKGGAPVQSTVQTGISKTQNKQRVIQNVPNIREGLKMLERDSELSKNYSDFGPSNDMNSGNYIAKNNETGRYEVVGHYNTDDTITILANNKQNKATVNSPQQKEQAVQEKNSLTSDFIRLKGKRDSLAQENKRIGKQAKDANNYPADAQKKVIGNQKKIDALEKEMSMKKARIDELDKAISSYKDPKQLNLFK